MLQVARDYFREHSSERTQEQYSRKLSEDWNHMTEAILLGHRSSLPILRSTNSPPEVRPEVTWIPHRGRFMLTDFMKSSTRWTLSERVWLSNDWRIFSLWWRNGCVLSLGLKMSVLEACIHGLALGTIDWGRVAYLKRVCHVLETYTRMTETHQTLWVQQNHCFSISDPHSAGVTQRGWISRLEV